MSKSTRRTANCAMVTALGLVIMLVLGFTGFGTYAAPVLASLLLVPMQREYGTGYALLIWIATGILCLVLVPDWEQSVVYLSIFGWYPALRPQFQKLPGILSTLAKAAVFNLTAIVSYLLMIPFLGLTQEMMAPWLWGAVLLIGNLIFQMIDRAMIPIVVPRLERRFGKSIRY